VVARPVLTAVPTSSPTLLGLACSRNGTVVAVHDLAGLLGRPHERPRWMVIPKAQPGLGIAFEHFTGHHKLTPADPDTALLVSLVSVTASVQTSREIAR
jgi:chemotaxis signal transduction protein